MLRRLFSDSVLNVKALVGTFNQDKALVGAFSVIIQLRRLIICNSIYFPLYLMSSSPRLWTAQLTSQYLRDASSTWSMKKVRSSAL